MWHIEKYRAWMDRKNFSPRTQETYLWHLTKFIEWGISQGISGIDAIVQHHIQAHRKTLKTYKARTINIVSAILKGYFKCLKNEGLIALEPKIEYIKEPKTLPRLTLPDQIIRKILVAPDPHHLLGYRDRSILELLYTTGVRKQELLNLDLKDIDIQEGYCRIMRGKGGKDRVVPIGKTACQVLENYLKGIRPILTQGNTQEKALFLTHRGTRLGGESLRMLIRRAAFKARIEGPVTPHVFRRSCATGMIRNHANPYYIKELLGHAKLSSLEPYLKLTIMDLKEVHAKCHPREKGEPKKI
ncbi:MAG: tyrosine-type recombinase/integrase [Chlamydiae bacterium]|nr:tyrosine-type recombinase/integrase [Chlamydiota bacterium]